ncbi:MAG TPA: SDR family NAD(P)-dependent oxidoreductase, partial [Arenicellales bacterium]|nr:SDR family NAD(P)-dependent oxidoreductase [Arenicellales bacterium]
MDSKKVAIVTAAGGGIGKAVSQELGRQGYNLVLMSRSDASENLANDLGGVGLRGSVTDASDLERLVDTAMNKYGRIDVVVNHTAHPPKGDLLSIDDEAWHAGLDMLILNVV